MAWEGCGKGRNGYGKESGVGMVWDGSGWSGLSFASEFLHLAQPRYLDVQCREVVELRLDLAAMVDVGEVGVEEVCGEVGTGARGSGDESAL
jgi:hypothetical protein